MSMKRKRTRFIRVEGEPITDFSSTRWVHRYQARERCTLRAVNGHSHVTDSILVTRFMVGMEHLLEGEIPLKALSAHDLSVELEPGHVVTLALNAEALVVFVLDSGEEHE